MNRDSIRRLARLHRAQTALTRRARAERLVQEAELQRLAGDASAILQALNADSPLHGLIVPTMAKALTRNAEEAGAAEGALAAAAHGEEEERVRKEHLMTRLRGARHTAKRRAERLAAEELSTAALARDPLRR